ncbi:NnrU family protein [Dokdonella sp.]|uniref:NnrU family protein n=1 Tax=Dokdonella sp. TaxID=2291710 RepID=UPI003C36ABE8
MWMLILGLMIFLGMHSLRMLAPEFRDKLIARHGANAWRGIYSLVSIGGFVLIVWGFGLARQTPVLLYSPPMAMKHANMLFTLLAFVLIAATYVPRNHIKAKLGHPMLVGVKLWAFGHLLATGFLHDVILFGAFLAWAVADFAVCRRRDRKNNVTHPAGTASGDVITVAIGLAAWAGFAFWLHLRWIGVNPFT